MFNCVSVPTIIVGGSLLIKGSCRNIAIPVEDIWWLKSLSVNIVVLLWFYQCLLNISYRIQTYQALPHPSLSLPFFSSHIPTPEMISMQLLFSLFISLCKYEAVCCLSKVDTFNFIFSLSLIRSLFSQDVHCWQIQEDFTVSKLCIMDQVGGKVLCLPKQCVPMCQWIYGIENLFLSYQYVKNQCQPIFIFIHSIETPGLYECLQPENDIYDSMTGVFEYLYYEVVAAYCMNLVLFFWLQYKCEWLPKVLHAYIYIYTQYRYIDTQLLGCMFMCFYTNMWEQKCSGFSHVFILTFNGWR